MRGVLSMGNVGLFRAEEDGAERLENLNKHPYRSVFQRDRDRILYSKEFRRLSGKTQIFVTGSDDNMRTRLTHTLEVAQIAETISDRLGLNSMLTKAIALGHDIGHTPFGHVGERTLNYIMNGCFEYYGYNNDLREEDKGFKHNLQGLRVACELEDSLDDNNNLSKGLNLTKYTLWGIQNHSSLKYKECDYCKNHRECRYKNSGKECNGNLSVDYYKEISNKINDRDDWTFEGIIVAYADEIAQRHHDIEDGIYAGIINTNHLFDYIVKSAGFDKGFTEKIEKFNCEKNGIRNKDGMEKDAFNVDIRFLSRAIIDHYVTRYSDELEKKVSKLIEDNKITETGLEGRKKIFDCIKNEGVSIVKFFGYDDVLKAADNKFNKYLMNHILYSHVAQCMDGKASFIIRQLVKAYLTNPQQLPDRTIILIKNDWCKLNNVGNLTSQEYTTEASNARDWMKEIMKKDDSDFKTVLLRRICDFIAGMSDSYAMDCFERLYSEKGYEYR